MFGAAPLLIAAAAVAVVAIAVWIWMALALGALLRKLGGRPGLAWVPVARWVEAARGARMPAVPVAIARIVGLLGLVALAVGVVLVAGAAADASGTTDSLAIDPTTRALLVGGGIAYGLGSLVGWALWIYGAGTIEMRLKAPAALTWLAAISPVIWASVMGWGRYGRPVESVRTAASGADALAAAAPSSPSPAAASSAGPVEEDGAPAGGWDALAAGAAAAPTWDGVAAREREVQQASRPESAEEYAPVTSSASEPEPVTAPMRGLWAQVSWPDDPVTLDEVSVPAVAASADDGAAAAATASGADDAHGGESVAWREAQAALDAEAERHAEPEPYTGPVSPYLGSSQEPQTAELAPDLGGDANPFDTPIPATAELQEIPWMAPAPTPPTPSAPSPAAPSPAAPSPVAPSPAAPTPAAPEEPAVAAEPASQAGVVPDRGAPGPVDSEPVAAAVDPQPDLAPASPQHHAQAPSAPSVPNPWDFIHETPAQPSPSASTTPVPASAPAVVPLDAQPAAPTDADLDLPTDFETAAPSAAQTPPAPASAPETGQPSPDSAPTLQPTTAPTPLPPTTAPTPLPPVPDATAPAAASAPSDGLPAVAPVLSPWAPRQIESPSAQTAPMSPPTPPASSPGDDEDDHTVMVQRNRHAWVLETSDGVRYVLPEERITVGRAAARISPGVMGVQDETRTMSKVHAELTLVNGQWHARDLGSTNGTFVRVDGSERQVPQDVASPVDGDLLLGDLVARIVATEEGSRR